MDIVGRRGEERVRKKGEENGEYCLMDLFKLFSFPVLTHEDLNSRVYWILSLSTSTSLYLLFH